MSEWSPFARSNKAVCGFLVLITLALPGCDSSKPPRITVPPPSLQQHNSLSKPSEEIKVNLFLDASESMKGFVTVGSPSNYVQLIRNLDNLVVSGWKKSIIESYKFGSHVQPLSGRNHLKALEKSFYQETGLSSNTQIDKVLSDDSIYDKGNLNLIVTDLFQKDSDAVLLAKLLKEKCLAKNIAIGVIGVKSRFYGFIYDAGLDNSTYWYESGDDPKKFRPFYIIAIGKQEDIVNAYEQLSKNLPTDSSIVLTVVSNAVLRRPATFAGAEKVGKSGNKFHIVDDITQDPSGLVRQLKLIGDEDAQIDYSVKLDKLAHVPALNSSTCEVEIQGEEFGGGPTPAPSQALKANMALSGVNGRLSISVKQSEIKEGRVYRFHLGVFPPQTAFTVPAWWAAWNMEVTEVVSRKIDKDAVIDGSRTQNLNMFMNGLWQANLLVNRPKIFDSYVYLRR